MGYNISEVTGSTGGGTLGLDTWTFDVAFDGSGPTTVTGDFDEVPLGGGASSEPTNGYSYGALSTTQYGTLTTADTNTGVFTFTIDRDAFIASGSDQTITFTVTGDDGGSSDTDTVIINLLICVARGTLIETADGPVPVEQLSYGDLVVTADGARTPVRWASSRRIDGVALAANPSLYPIRITAGAFGPDRPIRDLWVSPHHRVLVADWRAELYFGAEEVLVPAKALVNGDTIHVDRRVDEVEYFHILFDQHELMLTEGLATESFHPGEYVMREIEPSSRAELLSLFPEYAKPGGVPDTARMALRPWEGALLLQDGDHAEPLRLAS